MPMEIEAAQPRPLQVRAASQDTPARIQKAATDFEALLLAQMLKTARQTSKGSSSDGDGEDSETNSTVLELGEQEFARTLASNGGLGLAKMVVAGLKTHAD